MTARDYHSELLDLDSSEDKSPPPVLLPYQQEWIADEAQLKIYEKSRRVGITWAESSDNVLDAAKKDGTNVFYIGPTQDMALEYVEACAMWARAFDMAATAIEEGIFVDTGAGENGADKAIKTYKIDFPGSGKRIVALSSRPTNLRGKQGIVVIDEAAFHNDLSALLKAALAMLLWGDKVRIISTHDGVENQFNELIQEVRSKKRKGSVHRTTFKMAVEQGLYRRVCLRRHLTWSQDAEDAWVKDAYSFYGEHASEELDAIPSQGGGKYFSTALIEACMSPDTPLVRKHFNAEFNLTPEPIRAAEVLEWCREALLPHLITLDPKRPHAYGEDFGRHSDLTVIIVGEEGEDLNERVKLQVELSNCPFTQQEQILSFVVSRLPRFRKGAMDAGGNGAALAEKAADEFGGTRIEQIKLSEKFYQDNFPTLKGAMEDRTFRDLPRDSQTRDDLRSVTIINGIPRVPTVKTQRGDGERLTRHGDAAIACMMLHFAFKCDTPDIAGVRLGETVRGSADTHGFMSE